MGKAVFCIADFGRTETILVQLEQSGFSRNDISVLMADKHGTRDFALEHHTKTPEGAVAGAGTGVVVGGIVGWLAGIGSLAVPGLGPLIAAGPIMGMLTGAAVLGTIGGVAGALIGLGVPEFEARKYEGKVRTGSALIAIHTETNDEVARAKQIFQENGAEDITTGSEMAVAQHQ